MNSRKDGFCGLKREQRRKRYGAFDCETNGLNGEFILLTCCYETKQGVSETKVFDRVKDFLEYILTSDERSKIIWYAHNAEYDWRYFLPDLLEMCNDSLRDFRIVPLLRSTTTIFQITVYRGNKKAIVMRDSMAIFPHRLRDFAAQFSSKPKLDIGLADGVLFDKHNPTHIEYAKADSEVLLESLINYSDMIHSEYGVFLKSTVASTSFNAFLRTIDTDQYYNRSSRQVDDFIRKGYYGGMVYIKTIDTELEKVFTFDINSSYPHVMQTSGVPYGNATYSKEYDKEKPGFWRCVVDTSNVKTNNIHFIPYRNKHGIIWASGLFQTIVSSVEIEEGLKRGYSFKILDGYYFDKVVYPFNDFVDKCKSLRVKYKKKPLETVAKLMQNSLYGKFGMGVDGTEYLMSPEMPSEEGWSFVWDEDNNTLPGIWAKNVERQTNYMLPHWSAWITANARINLVKFVETAGYENFLYADTDSITCNDKGRVNLLKSDVVGNDYGQLKEEGIKYNWLCFAPKCYVYKDENGEYYGKIKGIPKSLCSQEYLERIFRGDRDAIKYNSTNNVLATIKTSQLEVARTRKPTNNTNLNGWNIVNNEALPKAVFS